MRGVVASSVAAPHEAGLLNLSIEKARSVLGWHPKWDFETAVARTMNWYRNVEQGACPIDMTLRDIEAYAET